MVEPVSVLIVVGWWVVSVGVPALITNVLVGRRDRGNGTSVVRMGRQSRAPF